RRRDGRNEAPEEGAAFFADRRASGVDAAESRDFVDPAWADRDDGCEGEGVAEVRGTAYNKGEAWRSAFAPARGAEDPGSYCAGEAVQRAGSAVRGTAGRLYPRTAVGPSRR